MSKKYGPPSPGDEVARLLRRRGVNLDPQRLDERLAAERSREKREFAEYRSEIETLASAARKARRQVETEEYSWRQRPTAENLQRAKDAQLGRKRAEDQLLESLLGDRDLYRRLLD
jgi:hypothetical protein